MRRQLVWVSGEAPKIDPLLFEQGHKPTADVAGCSREQDDGGFLFITNFRLKWRHCFWSDFGGGAVAWPWFLHLLPVILPGAVLH